MTISPLTAAPAFAPAFATVVPGLNLSDIDLTLVLQLNAPSPALRYVVERMCEALYAQCISFELVGVADAEAPVAEELTGLPLTHLVRGEGADLDEWLLAAGPTVAASRWIGFLDVNDLAEVDPYGFIELLHQARERSAGRA